jgi:hypothetical protein
MAADAANQDRMAKAAAWITKHEDDSQEALIVQFTGLTEQFTHEVSGLSDARFDFKPSAEEWSVREVCLHVSKAIPSCAAMMKQLAGGQKPEEKSELGQMNDDSGAQTDVISMLEGGFKSSLASLDCLDGTENLEATLDHPFFGALHCRRAAVFNNLHLIAHVKQVQRIKGDENFPTS